MVMILDATYMFSLSLILADAGALHKIKTWEVLKGPLLQLWKKDWLTLQVVLPMYALTAPNALHGKTHVERLVESVTLCWPELLGGHPFLYLFWQTSASHEL